MANNAAPVRSRVPDIPTAERGGFCGALQRIQPSMPAVLARRLANKENYGLGKVSRTSTRSIEYVFLYFMLVSMFRCLVIVIYFMNIVYFVQSLCVYVRVS